MKNRDYWKCMQIHAGWEFGTWHLSLTNPKIIILFSTWEYKIGPTVANQYC